MRPATDFKAVDATVGAYWLMFSRVGALVTFTIVWSAVGVFLVGGGRWAVEQLSEAKAGGASVVLLSTFTEIGVLLVAQALINIAWHRHIVLGEPLVRLFPADGRTSALYIARLFGWIWAPTLVATTVIWLAANGLRIDTDGWPFELAYDTVLVVLTAALTPFYLALTATAIRDNETTARAAWALSAGYRWRLFWGGIACQAPLTYLSFVIYRLSAGYDEASIEAVAVDSAISVLYTLAGVLCAVFVSFAYVPLIGDRPSERSPAGYFS